MLFAGEGERIEIVQRAHSRQTFATGAIKSIKYISGAPEGKISDMENVLGLK